MKEPAVQQIVTELQPRLENLVTYMGDTDNIEGIIYFTELLVQLSDAEVEADLLAWCIELSKAAFVGISYDNQSWDMTDDILARAEIVSMTFLANEEKAH